MNRLLLLSLSLTSLAASASVFDDVVNELVGNNLGLRVETVRSEASSLCRTPRGGPDCHHRHAVSP